MTQLLAVLDIVQLLSHVLCPVNKVPDIKEALVWVRGAPFRVCLNGCEELGELGGQHLALSGGRESRHGWGRRIDVLLVINPGERWRLV